MESGYQEGMNPEEHVESENAINMKLEHEDIIKCSIKGYLARKLVQKEKSGIEIDIA